MTYGIRYRGLAGQITRPGLSGLRPPEGVWCAGYDPDAHDGRGNVTWAGDPIRAVAFPTPREAMTFWRQESSARPLRPDGKPNRPFTAFSVSIEEIPT